jgi:2-polyprenyl-6-methoxyphenol hydroxylase-like FAD-dependent oxidoreductase
MTKLGENAIVLGASMGGLLAARVLADFYDTVTVVERDVARTPPAGRGFHRVATPICCWVVAPGLG